MKKINYFIVAMVLCIMGLSFGTDTYAQLYGPNLIVNGDFSDGNTGFDTDYFFVDPVTGASNALVPEGRYTVATNPRTYHPNFVNLPDNTDPFLIVNGHTVQTMQQQGIDNEYAIVWQQEILGVEEGKDYEFSFDLRSLVTTAPAQLSITIFINGTEFVQTAIAPGQTSEWVNHVWTNADKSTSATITIVETTKVKSGNDFGIDNIVFRSVEPEPAPCPDINQVVTVEVTPVTCYGGEDGQIKLILNGQKPFNACISYGCDVIPGDDDYEYMKTSIYTYGGLIAGFYTITVMDGNGCVYTLCVEVPQPDPIEAEISYDPILCFGETTTVVVTGMGGTPPYTLFNEESVAVATFDFDFPVEGLPAGTYNWTLGDANGCEPAVIEFTLTQPELLEADYEATEILCNGDLSTVTVFAMGGIAPYQLFDGEVFAGDLVDGQITLNVPAGDYLWTVKDANGCDAIVEFTLEQPEPLEADYELGQIACFEGSADVVVTAMGGIAPYQLFDGEVFAGDLVDGQITLNIPAGSYLWTVIDANGCEAIVEFTLEQPALLEASYEATDILCFGDLSAVTVFAAGGTAPYQLFDGEVFAGDLVDGQITLNVPAGEYLWTVKDANGCEAEVEFTLTQPELLEAELLETQDASCFGAEDGMAWIAVTGGTPPYTASMGEFVDGVLVIEGLAAGSYTVTITDSKNCGPEEITFEIDQPEELTIDNIDIEIPLCAPDNFPGCEEPWAVTVVEYVVGTKANGGPVPADRQIAANALGAPDYSNSPPITFVSLGFGGHIILELGCEILNGEGDDFEVVETSYGQTQCNNYPERARVYVAQSADGPWSFLGIACLTTAFDLSNGVDGDGEPFVLESARFVKVVDVSNPAQFSPNSDGYDVNGIAIFNFAAGGMETATANISFSGVPEGMEPEFSIYDGEGNLVTISNVAEIGNLMPGTYTLVLQVGDCFSEEIEFTVPEFPEPIEAMATVEDVDCNGNLTGSATLTISGGTMPYSLEWTGQEAFEIDGAEYTISGLGAGMYTITIIDANGCLGEVDFTVEEPAVLEASVETGEILCFEGTTAVELTVGGGTAPYVLSDNNSDFALDIDVAGTIELSGLSAGEFSWTVTDANGCTVLVEFELTQPEQLEAEVTYEPIACFEGTTDVTVTATGGVGPYLLYNESIAEENLVTEFDGSFTVPGLGAGEYIWFVVDANGCDTPVEFELVQPEELTASFILDPENILCHNGVTTAIVFAEGGTEPYFLYDGDVLVAEFFGSYTVMDVAPGSYSWTVTDSKNCGPVAIEFELENPDPIIADVESTLDILCFNDNTGEIHVVAMGGTGALTYSLNGGEPQDNGSFYNLFAGDYVVTVTDENGCFITIDVELLQPEELTLDIFEIVHATGGQHNGQIWANIFGGVGPYNVCLHTECTLDDDGEDQPVLKSQGMMYWGLQPGWYMITVVDQNGCVVMECVEIINEEEDKIDDEALTDNNFVVAENTYVSAYPNPFRNNATIEFQVVQTQHVSLEVYNLIGERVAVLFNGVANAYETYKKNFDAGALPNGVYFYRLTLGDQVLFDRMILSR